MPPEFLECSRYLPVGIRIFMSENMYLFSSFLSNSTIALHGGAFIVIPLHRVLVATVLKPRTSRTFQLYRPPYDSVGRELT